MLQRPGKPIRPIIHRNDLLPPSQDVCPETDARARNVAPGDIEAFMPVVEIVVVRRFERQSMNTENLQKVTPFCSHDVG
jgi:hypothetical protein